MVSVSEKRFSPIRHLYSTLNYTNDTFTFSSGATVDKGFNKNKKREKRSMRVKTKKSTTKIHTVHPLFITNMTGGMGVCCVFECSVLLFIIVILIIVSKCIYAARVSASKVHIN